MVKTIWTAHISYREEDAVDITVKGNNPIGRVFAPTWDMVMDYKRAVKQQDWETPEEFTPEEIYTKRYKALLGERLPTIQEMFDFYTKTWLEELTFTCYCPPGAFCHRVILARDILKDVFNYRGERR